jgi:hypothetical protein
MENKMNENREHMEKNMEKKMDEDRDKMEKKMDELKICILQNLDGRFPKSNIVSEGTNENKDSI